MMKITKHIAFWYDESRFKYVNQIIDAVNNYGINTDIFLHTNKYFNKETTLTPNEVGNFEIIVHDMSNIHGHHLTWKCRDLLKSQANNYDIFMYVEDDILIKKEAINYWFRYKDICLEYNYNLGFLRIETDKLNNEFVTDIPGANTRLNSSLMIKDIQFAINDINPYCASWIYDKQEFNRWINSSLYDINNIKGYERRESSAIGLHGNKTNWYKNTILPIIDDIIDPTCKIYHLPNNYIYSKTQFAKLKFEDIIKK